MAEQYHEPVEELSGKDRDLVRALTSLKEEVEAIMWYQQRVAAGSDAMLKSVLAHNRDEEIEHAVMALEWLRRNMGEWDEAMKTYLFTEAPITELEEEEESESEQSSGGDLGIGKLD
jgi:uncharacterized protein